MSEKNKCGAKTRSGTPCKRPAGWGTDHVGSGRCKLHGGASHGRPIKHGRYSKVARGSLISKIKMMQDDPDPMDLMSELQIQRALLAEALERLGDARITELPEFWEATSKLTKDVVNTVEKIERLRLAETLTATEVQYLKVRIIDLLEKYVPDPDARGRFVHELITLIPDRPAAISAKAGQ